MGWTREDAIYLCWKIEHIAPTYGCHVALTGGCLYKPIQEERKDVDILFYRVRQVEAIDVEGLFTALEEILDIPYPQGFGWCWKSTYKGKPIDFFFPEAKDGEYRQEDEPFNLPTHDWECVSPGMYDFLYRCRKCGKEYMESVDNPVTALPKTGCSAITLKLNRRA